MRKISIEFIEDRRWRFLWLLTSITCLGCVIALTWYGYQIAQQKREINLQIQSTGSVMPGALASVVSKQDSRNGSSLKSASLLQFDLNKVFNTIENIAEPSIRLVNMTFDASAGTMRLEYELESVETAVVLTEKLNTGYEAKPWKLESLSSARTSSTTVPNIAAPKTNGVWSCQIKHL